MNKWFEFGMNMLPYIPLILCSVIGLFVSLKVLIKKLFKAKSVKDIKDATDEFVESVKEACSDSKLLYLKEVCRSAIYSKEKAFNSVAGKNGALKMDSVLNTVQLECYKLNYEYNEEFWKDYISTEVSNMKEVH